MDIGQLEALIDQAFEDRDSITVIPDTVLSMLEPYGEIRSRGGSPFATLERT